MDRSGASGLELSGVSGVEWSKGSSEQSKQSRVVPSGAELSRVEKVAQSRAGRVSGVEQASKRSRVGRSKASGGEWIKRCGASSCMSGAEQRKWSRCSERSGRVECSKQSGVEWCMQNGASSGSRVEQAEQCQVS